MKQATQLQLSPNGQSCYQLQLVPSLQDKAGTSYPQPQQELPLSRETLLPQLDKDKTAPHRMPRLRAVVESQAFKNVLVDEMDMMLSRAATLIQANWRGYRLRQKLISQMTAAKAIQEAWRRFSTRRLLRSGKMVEKKVNLEEGDIPYHPPQQVRFQPLEEAKSLPAQPVMVSRETQFPSSDSLAACAHQLALLQSQGTPQPDVQAPGVTGGPGITFLPQQTITIRLPCPVSPDAKSQPCLMTRTVRSTCLVHHVEGDMMKTKQPSYARWPPSSRPCVCPLRTASCQTYPPAKLTKAQSLAHLDTCLTKVQAQARPANGAVKVQSQVHLPAGLSTAPSQAQMVSETAKCFHAAHQPAELSSKTQSQPLLAGFKASTQPCQHVGTLGTLPRAKLEDRLTQLPPHSCAQGKATQGPRQGPSRPRACHVAARAQPSLASPAIPCQEELGPMEAGVAGGQVWNSAPARATMPWDAVGSQVVADPRQSGELVVSVQDMEKIISQAVVTIQACARGYLVRRTIRVWHQWAIVIQAAWRGYRVRQELARLSRAAIVIQATWRGFCTRRGRAQQTLQPGTWAEMGGGTRTTSDHRCFQSCQPHVCALCQSLSPGLGSPPSVVMLVGSSPRTCHMCGQSLPTRVVHGTGQGSWSQAGTPWDCASQPVTPSLQQSHLQNKAATTIQSGWRGFLVRRRLRQQQGAAKMLQATWRGHSARSSLTTDALLGPAAWDNPQHTQWPGV
uniref:IQ domain-containing protein N n=1 Tax=Equus asinus TaxID=9793 RepID=A0A9L0K982_EQUAS